MMPEDKVISSEDTGGTPKNTRNLVGTIEGFPMIPDVPVSSGLPEGYGGIPGGELSPREIFARNASKYLQEPKQIPYLPVSSIYTGDRYKSSRPFENVEEAYAKQQSSLDKIGNGIGKLAGVTATTFLSGTAGLIYGIGQASNTGKFSDLWNNDLNKRFDQFNTAMEDKLPNYYTQAEKDSEWWQPANILTANFFSDKLVKNFGYALGALAGGSAWAKLLKGITSINSVVKAGQGLEALTAVESAMATVPKVQKITAFENALSSIAQKYVKSPIASVMNNGERITTSVMGTWGEASMESLQNANAFRANAIEKYKEEHGYAPTGADLAEIESYTERVGNFTLGMNIALLSATNYIQLPKILGSSRKADKLLINDIVQDAETGLFSAYKPTTKVGRLLSNVKNVSGLLFSPSEAFEEAGQFAIQTGTQDFFNRAYRDSKETSDFISTLGSVLSNVSDFGVDQVFNSKEGMESILLGGISGGLQQSGILGTYRDEKGKTKFGIGKSGEIGERGLFGTGGERAINTTIAVNALNKTKLPDILKSRMNYVGIALNSQKLRQEAILANDTLAEKDFEHDYVLSYVMPRAKYGREASVQQELSYYQSQAATDQGYDELVTAGIANANEKKEQFIGRIENLKKISKSVAALYDTLNDKYENVVDDQGKKKYSDYIIDKMVYAAAKIGNYDERIPQVNAKLAKYNISTLDVLQSMIGDNVPNAEATKVALDQINNLKTAEGLDIPKVVKDILKGDLIDVMELAEKRRRFVSEYDEMKESPDEYEYAYDEYEDEEFATIKQLEKNEGDKRAKTTSKEVEVGKEYSLAEPFRREGSQLQLAPKMTVLSKTLGGEYEVRLPNGQVTFLTPSEFKNYKITDADNTDQGYADILDAAITKVLGKAKYADIAGTIPVGEDAGKSLVEWVNEQNNPELARDIQKEFNAQSEAYTKIKEEENAALEDEQLADDLIEILNPDNTEEIADNENEAGEDSRKPDKVVISASIPSQKIPGYKRSIKFANKFYSLPTSVRDNLYAVFVTAKNQDKLIPGLVEYLAGQEATSSAKSQTITRNKVVLENLVTDFDLEAQKLFDNPNPTIEEYDTVVGNLEFDLEAEGLSEELTEKIKSQLRDIKKSFTVSKSSDLEKDKKGKKKVDANTTIAVVIVEKQADGTPKLVGVDGNILEAGQDPLENAIFQVMPLEGLKWSGEFNDETMFRDDTNKEQYKAIYAKRRAAILDNPDLVQRGFDVSMGIAKEKVDNSTPVKAAGLVTDAQLEDKAVLTIPTLGVDVLAMGSTSFKKPQGMVFLDQPNGHVRLYTSKITKKQAETIYDVLMQLSKTVMKYKGVTDEAEPMIDWLRTTLQWGSPKEGKQPGRSSVWFAKDAERKTDRLRLYFGAAKIDMAFKPTVLEKQKETILKTLMELNHNVNKKQSENTNDPYTEITGVAADGKLETKDWQNYQTYLLSAEGRNEEDIPLTTKLDALADSEDGINRISNYFIMKDFNDDEEFAPPAKSKTTKKTTAPEAPKGPKTGMNVFGFALASTGDREDVDYKVNADGSVKISSSAANEAVFEKLSKDELTLEKFRDKYDELYEGGAFAVASDELEPIEIIKQVAQERIENYLAQTAAVEEQEAKENKMLSMLRAMDASRGMGEEEEEEVPEENTFSNAVDKINNSLGKLTGLGMYEDSPKIVFEFDGKEPSFGYLTDPISKEGNYYRIKTLKYNVLIDENFNIVKVTSKEGKTYSVKENELSTVDIQSPFFDPQAPAPVVSDIEAKKADIERRRQEERRNLDKKLGYRTQEDQYEVIVINTKYNAELAALEGGATSIDKAAAKSLRSKILKGNSNYDARVRLDGLIKNFKGEDWAKVEEWLEKNYPNGVTRVKTVLRNTNGRQYWGIFKDGMVYVYKNAEAGTVYHEVFHAIFNTMLTPKEQARLREEFRRREGTFVDRPTGDTIKYSEATDAQIKEQLPEEFREYLANGTVPPKPTKARSGILGFFQDIIDMVKKFFTGKDARFHTEELFKNINTGKFKTYNPNAATLALGGKTITDIDELIFSGDADPSLITAGLTPDIINDIMHEMTYGTLRVLGAEGKSLFEVENLDRKELFEKLKLNIDTVVYDNLEEMANASVEDGTYTQEDVDPILADAKALRDVITSKWDVITKKFEEEYLSSYSVKLDENDEDEIKNEEKTGKEGTYSSPEKLDSFRKTTAAIKLFLATVPVKNPDGSNKVSSIGGVNLIPMGKVYNDILNAVNGSTGIDDMLEKFRMFTLNNSQYKRLYSRLTNNLNNELKQNPFQNIRTDGQMQLVSAFFTAFNLNNPDVKTTYILQGGEVSIGDTSLAGATEQAASQIENSIVNAIKDGKFFTYNGKSFVQKRKALLDVRTGKLEDNINFMEDLGVIFDLQEMERLPYGIQQKFIIASTGIRDNLLGVTATKELNKKTLKLGTRLRELGEIQAMIDRPDFQTTYFNLDGDQVQSYIGQNLLSDFYNVISSVSNKKQLKDTKFSYLLTDNFSASSVLMDRIFNPKTGDKREGVTKLMKVGYTGGVVNEITGKDRASGKLLYSERLIEELNLNLKGYYMNLVSGDSSLGWILTMGNQVSQAEILKGNDKILSIFKGYLASEIAVSKEKRKGLPEVEGRKNTDLRFFKGILGPVLHDKVVAFVNANKAATIDDVYAQFTNETTEVNDIDTAILKYIDNNVNSRIKNYAAQGLITEREPGVYFVKNIEFSNKSNLGLQQLKNNVKMLAVNYMINTIELHKLIYSDPYLYKDELKRIKNFSSPAKDLVSGSKEYNNAQNVIANEDYQKGDIGYTDETKDSLSSVVFDDVEAVEDLPDYKGHKETDGGGMIMMKANRRVRKRAGDWNKFEEQQYRYDVAWEKRDKRISLSPREVALLEKGNPKVTSAYTPLKPIARGRKANNKKYNDIMLDKFALYVYSYRILKEINPTSNALKMYDKMQKADIDYGVFKSGRKVGAEKTIPLYNADGTFNSAAVNKKTEITEVPLGILAIQSEVPSKEDEKVRRGTQPTKLVTLDFLDCGLPFDFMGDASLEDRIDAWKELSEDQKRKASDTYRMVRTNDDLVRKITDNNYKSLLNQIGYKDGKLDLQSLGKYLRKQIVKGNANENILKAVDSLIAGNKDIEATPAYQQIVNTLYSIAQNTFATPKMTGGMKVQISSALLESVRGEKKTINGKEAFTSDVLKFYRNKKGERVCEIMIRRWFKSDMSDEALLKYLNTDEGQKILSSVGFRTPTQKQNSIDRFVVKKFLPQEFGDSIVVPSALVAKAGSDFDIDKLYIYLKNIYKDPNGKIRLIKSYDSKKESDKDAEKIFNDILARKISDKEAQAAKNEGLQNIIESIEFRTASKKTVTKWTPIFREMFGDDASAMDIQESLMNRLKKIDKQLDKLNDEDIQAALLEEFKDDFYSKSLENAYIESMEELISSEQNFARLIKPNSAEILQKIARKIVIKKFGKEFDYANTTNLLDQTFMSTIRYAFVSGKYAIGIAAQAQTNHALNQRGVIIVDHRKYVSPQDALWLGDKKVYFNKFNKLKIGKEVFPLLSRVKDANDEHDISDIIGQFIDGYVDIAAGPWIMELGAGPVVAPTWLFLVKIGVPIQEVADFMNQPVILDYLKQLQASGYPYLFSREAFDKVRLSNKYRVGEGGFKTKGMTLPSGRELSNAVGKDKLDDREKLQQVYILTEFLKYSKMAEHLFRVTQATKFDTANINNPDSLYKMSSAVGENSNSEFSNNLIGSATNNILNNSFIGEIFNKYIDIRNIYAEAIVSERRDNREAINDQLLSKYKYLGDRKFTKLAKKIRNNIFDFSVQTISDYNKAIGGSLVYDNNTAKQIRDFVEKVKGDEDHELHNNLIINSFQYQPSEYEGGADSIKLTGKDNKTYDQNQIIYSFAQLKEYLKANNQFDLYKGLITLSVVQSGLNNSPISFTGFIPYEDFREVYADVMSKLNPTTIAKFAAVNAFERNNWNNPDVVSFKKPKIVYDEEGYATNDLKSTITLQHEGLQAAMERGELPQMLNIALRDRAARKDFLVYTWEEGTTEEKQAMKDANDFSYIKKGLFKKVYDETTGKPLIYGIKKSFIYKQINAWGDSFRANEFYDHARVSQINNGFDPVEFEKADYEIAGYINNDQIQKDIRKGYQTGPTEEDLQANFENNLIEDEDNLTYEEEIPEEVLSSQRIDPSNMTYQTVYKLVDATDSPDNAYGLALQYIASGGKINEESLYKEVIATRDDRLAAKKRTRDEFKARDYMAKNVMSITEIGESIWQSLDENVQNKITDQDVINALLDVVGSFNTRLGAAREFVSKFSTEDDAARITKGNIISIDDNTTLLKNGQVYNNSDINSKLLEEMNYTPKQIAKILKEIC